MSNGDDIILDHFVNDLKKKLNADSSLQNISYLEYKHTLPRDVILYFKRATDSVEIKLQMPGTDFDKISDSYQTNNSQKINFIIEQYLQKLKTEYKRHDEHNEK